MAYLCVHWVKYTGMFLSSADILKHSCCVVVVFLIRNTTRVSNSLDPDQARQMLGPELYWCGLPNEYFSFSKLLLFCQKCD